MALDPKVARAKRIGCDPAMLLPDGRTCSDCLSFPRCKAFVSRRGDEQNCDWSPSRFRLNLQPKVDELTAALRASVEVIKAWHGPEVWDIYYTHAPEMKPIRELLGPLK